MKLLVSEFVVISEWGVKLRNCVFFIEVAEILKDERCTSLRNELQ